MFIVVFTKFLHFDIDKTQKQFSLYACSCYCTDILIFAAKSLHIIQGWSWYDGNRHALPPVHTKASDTCYYANENIFVENGNLVRAGWSMQ